MNKTILLIITCIAATTFSTMAQTPMAKFCSELKQRSVASDESFRWTQFGPGMSGNNKIAIWHPTDPKVLFIAPNMGNSYRSEDGGATYESILDGDGGAGSLGLRGPKSLNFIDFSRQNPDFGLSTSLTYGGLYLTEDRGKTWRHIGSDIFAETHLSDVSVDPKDDNIWYLGSGALQEQGELFFTTEYPHGRTKWKTLKGKIWKSTNRGESWTLINKGIDPNAEIETIMVDPVNSNILYATTTYGFYRSDDGGERWIESNNGLDHNALRSFASHYDSASDQLTMYVIAAIRWRLDGQSIADDGGGIYRSRDRGRTWECINGDIAMDMTYFQENKGIRERYMLAVAYYFGMTKEQFAEQHPLLPKSITHCFNQIEVDPNDPDNIYVVNIYANLGRNNFRPGQMWRSTDGGKHWYVTFRNGKNWDDGKDIEYWKSRNNPVGSNLTFCYLNEWMAKEDYDSKSANMARFNCDGTILHSQMSKVSVFSYDKGDTWVDIDETRIAPDTYVGGGNSNVPGHGFYQDVRLPNQVFCCAGENNLWITCDGGDEIRKGAQAATVHHLSGVEQSLSSYVIHPRDTTIRYALFFRQEARGELLRSVDSGKSWSHHGVAIPLWRIEFRKGDQPTHQLNLMIDGDNPDNMYFCVPRSTSDMGYVGNSMTGFGVNRSSDGGATWSSCNVGLPKSCDVAAICFDPKDFNTLYAAVQGRGGGLFISKNGGDSWMSVASAASLTRGFGVNDIHFDRDGLAYITTGHKSAEVNDGGAWVSRNGMKSWKRIFDFPAVFRIETAHYDPKVIMLSTLTNISIGTINAGTYLSEDGGKSWIKFNLGNGQSDRINDIAIDNYNSKFYTSTSGSGWYMTRKEQ